MYGPVSVSLNRFSDLSYKEFLTIAPLLGLTVLLGFFPNYILAQLESFSYNLLEYYN